MLPVINKVHKGYKDSFSMEIHKVDNVNRGLYTVDGSIHPRKDLQIVTHLLASFTISQRKCY